MGADMYELIFQSSKPLRFFPGQYLEWTLPHEKMDSRGNRRYFTIASSPTENDIHIGVKIGKDRSSSFKQKLLLMQKGEMISATQLAGDFTLPTDARKKLVFIAGGIGVTPYRSMVKYLIDKRENRDIVLFYAHALPDGFVYKDLFETGRKIGLKTHYLLTVPEKDTPKGWNGKVGYLTKEMLQEVVPDYKDRVFYLSGPSRMVDTYKELLRSVGVFPTNIVTDYFPGF